MFISSKLVFLPPSCQHCWNLQRLLDLSEITLFHLRPWWGHHDRGKWCDRARESSSSSLVTLSCIRCSGKMLCSRWTHLSPQFVDLVPGVSGCLTAPCFPSSAHHQISRNTQISTQPCQAQGGAPSQHQHCLTPLVTAVITVLCSLVWWYCVLTGVMLPPHCPGHNWALEPGVGRSGSQVGRGSLHHYISHRCLHQAA